MINMPLSQMENELAMWLQENAAFPYHEKIDFVKNYIAGLDVDLLLHYAAAGFVLRSQFPELLKYSLHMNDATMQVTALLGKSFEARKRNKRGKDAGAVSNAIRAARAKEEHAIWQCHANTIWAEPGKAGYKKTQVARIIQSRHGVTDIAVEYIARKITKTVQR